MPVLSRTSVESPVLIFFTEIMLVAINILLVVSTDVAQGIPLAGNFTVNLDNATVTGMSQ